MTGTVERSLGVGTVSINMTVMGVVFVVYCKGCSFTLADVWNDKPKERYNKQTGSVVIRTPYSYSYVLN